MSYLHSNNAIHRDLKPANIIIDAFLYPKIAYFGLSKILHKMDESDFFQSTINIKGSSIYIAPEVWKNQKYTTTCNIYSFGIIVYEIMTCQEPFKGWNLNEIISKIRLGIRPKVDGILPKSYQRLIEKC